MLVFSCDSDAVWMPVDKLNQVIAVRIRKKEYGKRRVRSRFDGVSPGQPVPATVPEWVSKALAKDRAGVLGDRFRFASAHYSMSSF